MDAIEFPEQNVTIGENETEYKPLPAYLDTKNGRVVCCFQFSDDEKELFAQTGRVWLEILTFNQPLQPIYMTVNKEDVLGIPDEQ